MLTADQHQDLTARLEALIREYAPASQVSGATAKVHHILAAVPIAAAPAPDPAPEEPTTDHQQ